MDSVPLEIGIQTAGLVELCRLSLTTSIQLELAAQE